jgi:arsenate reductase (thioredoxin)
VGVGTKGEEAMFTTIGVLVAVAMAGPAGEKVEGRRAPGPVVFVCEHGSAKSLIAREWFDRLARERGLPVRGVSLGVVPDAAVPAPIAEALGKDGFDVRAFVPSRADAAALEGASLVVAIGLERPGALPVPPDGAVEVWEGIPPTSPRYEATRDALRQRIEALLERLEADRRP